ncbi:MAG: GGDEF domain-containing protein [Gemmatimonadales bacterium]
MATAKQPAPEFWTPPDLVMAETGEGAEPLIAPARLGLTLALLIIPFANLVLGLPDEGRAQFVGLGVILAAALLATGANLLTARVHGKRWVPFVTSLMDVTLVSLPLIGFGVLGDPHQSVNNKIAFETYFLAIGATCLRFDPRLAVIAGGGAMLQYAAIVLWAVLGHDLGSAAYAPWAYGRFEWTDQVARLLVLGLFSVLCAVVVVRLRRQRARLSRDPLTGLYNRASFDEFLAAEIRRSKRYGDAFAAAMLDLDRFKHFNDTYGHAAGDEALRTVAEVVRSSVRGSDLVARYGGEEFVLIMPRTGLAQASRRLEQIRGAVAQEAIQLPKRAEKVSVTISAGVASWPEEGDNPEDLIYIADARLFQAKALGRNRIVATSDAAASV